ncbi:MAG: hypothetical protein GYA18_06240 [Chloroflexi bacterium]|nr:hypothetical protein [Chloroflexota bacterium]
MPTAHNSSSLKTILIQSLLTILYAVLAFLCCILLLYISFNIWYAGRIFPGVFFNGISLGGYTQQEAQQIIQTQVLPALSQTITFRYKDQTWQTNLLEMGIHFDAEQIAAMAFATGRSGNLSAWSGDAVAVLSENKTIPATIQIDESMTAQILNRIAAEFDQPKIEAQLTFEGNNVITTPGQIGVKLDIEQTLASIQEAISKQDYNSVFLVVSESHPDIVDAEPYAQSIREFLTSDFSLVIPAENNHVQYLHDLSSSTFAPMLQLVKSNIDGQITIGLQFQESMLRSLLSDLAQTVNIKTENPRFIFNDNTKQIDLLESGIYGRTLNINASIAAIQQSLANGAHVASLVFDYEAPAVADGATGTELGITELVQQQSTYFYGSSAARIQNIQTATNHFLGLLVAPGEVFSMAEAMGEISLDTGFTEALIIYNGKTIEGVGGGVCQVSTTLFRTAFFAGYPILERYPHAYRVSFYEKTAGNQRDINLAGLDATVYVPLVDLKFQNDTPYWLLMEAYVYPESSQIVWKFYSTNDGRQVKWQTTGPVNIVAPPEPKYYLNTSLKEGEIKQVDWEAEGADVRVDRWVYKDDTLFFQDQFHTHYEPWGAVYEIGLGVDGYPISEE